MLTALFPQSKHNFSKVICVFILHRTLRSELTFENLFLFWKTTAYRERAHGDPPKEDPQFQLGLYSRAEGVRKECRDTQVLQCGAVRCSVLQCATVYCSVLRCVAVCCSVLQCVHLQKGFHKECRHKPVRFLKTQLCSHFTQNTYERADFWEFLGAPVPSPCPKCSVLNDLNVVYKMSLELTFDTHATWVMGHGHLYVTRVDMSHGTWALIYLVVWHGSVMFIGKVVFICLKVSVNLVYKFQGKPGTTTVKHDFNPNGLKFHRGSPWVSILSWPNLKAN